MSTTLHYCENDIADFLAAVVEHTQGATLSWSRSSLGNALLTWKAAEPGGRPLAVSIRVDYAGHVHVNQPDEKGYDNGQEALAQFIPPTYFD
jgi:hypothetical protein